MPLRRCYHLQCDSHWKCSSNTNLDNNLNLNGLEQGAQWYQQETSSWNRTTGSTISSSRSKWQTIRQKNLQGSSSTTTSTSDPINSHLLMKPATETSIILGHHFSSGHDVDMMCTLCGQVTEIMSGSHNCYYLLCMSTSNSPCPQLETMSQK